MKERKDLQKMSAAMMKMRTPLNMIDGDGKKKKTYDGGYEAPGMHDIASKTTTRTKRKGKYGDKTVTRKLEISSDTPYHGRATSPGNVAADRETLTRTKTVRKGAGPRGGKTVIEREKPITEGRAARIKKRIRKHDASIKTNPYR